MLGTLTKTTTDSTIEYLAHVSASEPTPALRDLTENRTLLTLPNQCTGQGAKRNQTAIVEILTKL